MTAIMPGRHRRSLDAHATDRRVQHVLLAIDGGPASDAAVRWVADRARSHVLEVDLVQVEAAGGREPGPTHPGSGGRAAGRAQQQLGLHAPSATTRVRPVVGDRHRVLAQLGDHADLLVLGTRRTAHGRPHLLAGLATRLAESVRCPTVVVPRGWQPSAGPIVVGVHGDGSDLEAVDFAAREAIVLHRDLVLVHAWRLAAGLAAGLEADRHESTEHAAAMRLDRVAERVRTDHPAARAVRILEPGDAVEALIRAGGGASFLVVGRHAVTLIDRLLLRSVSRGVLERPTCPVAVVPHRPLG
jgi:nucleotide-binding universal stress UspA family protein